MLLLVAALPLSAEFLRIDVAFEDIGCASCIESLEGRLARVRGVERVEIDAKRGVATLHLAAKNHVRLRPLLSRITQDGTKVARIDVIALGSIQTGSIETGSIETTTAGFLFQPSGLTQAYRLKFEAKAIKGQPRSGATYKVRGEVSRVEPGAKPILQAISVTMVTIEAVPPA
jgi:copper chaperone CopZ